MSTTLVSGDISTIDFTATTTGRAAGAQFVINQLVCVAKVAIAASGTGAVFISGRHSLTKATNKPITWGAKVYMDSANKINAVSTGNVAAGRAAATASTTESKIETFINFGGG